MVRKFVLDSIEEVAAKWQCKVDDTILQYNKDEYQIDKYVPVLLENDDAVERNDNLDEMNNKITIRLLKWGMITGEIYNYHARIESIEETKSYKWLIDKSRCVVPAHGFNEWDTKGQAHQILENTLSYYAAIYKNGEIVILT